MVQNNVKKKYFEELAFNLQREGFTAEYIQQMEAAPILKASGLDEDQ